MCRVILRKPFLRRHVVMDNGMRQGATVVFFHRQHVVTVHGMRHMRNFKMQWYGDSANIPGKKDRYMDKSHVWNQKIKVMAKFLILEI